METIHCFHYISNNESKEIIIKQNQQVWDCSELPPWPWPASHDLTENKWVVRSLKDKGNTTDIDVRGNKLREV